ncbi:MAG: tRNA (mnm(5)s(2)U34)-methyltransferase [Candidatus Kapaibacteriota bacterium]
MLKITQLVHLLVRTCFAEPSSGSPLFAIDATVGNGYDTLLLAECVGENGMVFGFDIQDMSMARTRLEKHGLAKRVTLFQTGHETMLSHIADSADAGASAIIFNLGYLPNGDKSLVTTRQTTLAALSQSLMLLKRGGILSVACYSGHPGGEEETNAVLGWAKALPHEEYSVLHHHLLNRQRASPELVVVQKI